AVARSAFQTPILIALDGSTGRLEYWPLHRGGSAHARWLSESLGITYSTGMVADGDQLYIASDNPKGIVTYNVDTKLKGIIADPYGEPLDLAIGKDAALYSLHSNTVLVYPAGSSQAYQLSCQYMTLGEAIAVDNESDVFVNGYGPGQFEGVVEYPVGSTGCTKLPLKTEIGYATGLGVDPNNDNLVVVDNVYCAGGREGRMIVYRRPYGSKIGHVRNLKANCPGQFRFDATATVMLFGDTYPELRSMKVQRRVCIAYSCVDQRTYPNLRHDRTYVSGYPKGFTTIPNTLPN
ncbi:MAG TPA: hypothetical protein VGG70_04555, partial [Candidatus Cybelea sp.]